MKNLDSKTVENFGLFKIEDKVVYLLEEPGVNYGPSWADLHHGIKTAVMNRKVTTIKVYWESCNHETLSNFYTLIKILGECDEIDSCIPDKIQICWYCDEERGEGSPVLGHILKKAYLYLDFYKMLDTKLNLLHTLLVGNCDQSREEAHLVKIYGIDKKVGELCKIKDPLSEAYTNKLAVIRDILLESK